MSRTDAEGPSRRSAGGHSRRRPTGVALSCNRPQSPHQGGTPCSESCDQPGHRRPRGELSSPPHPPPPRRPATGSARPASSASTSARTAAAPWSTSSTPSATTPRQGAASGSSGPAPAGPAACRTTRPRRGTAPASRLGVLQQRLRRCLRRHPEQRRSEPQRQRPQGQRLAHRRRRLAPVPPQRHPGPDQGRVTVGVVLEQQGQLPPRLQRRRHLRLPRHGGRLTGQRHGDDQAGQRQRQHGHGQGRLRAALVLPAHGRQPRARRERGAERLQGRPDRNGRGSRPTRPAPTRTCTSTCGSGWAHGSTVHGAQCAGFGFVNNQPLLRTRSLLRRPCSTSGGWRRDVVATRRSRPSPAGGPRLAPCASTSTSSTT